MSKSDLDIRLKYLRTKFIELVSLCQKDAVEKDVSPEVRNITQDILMSINKLLDNLMYEYFEKKIFPKLNDSEKKKIEKQIQFPIAPTDKDFESLLGKMGLKHIKTNDRELFDLLYEHQPFLNEMQWIKSLRDYANLCHRKLLPQTKQKDVSITLGNAIKIGGGAKVIMKNCLVNGVPVDVTIDKGVITGTIDARLNPKIETKVSYLFQGTNINVLGLCEKSLEEFEKIRTKFKNILF